MTERDQGYYWVKFEAEDEPFPAFFWFGEDQWSIAGSPSRFGDGAFAEIGEPCRREDSRRLAAVVAYCEAERGNCDPFHWSIDEIVGIAKGEAP